MSISEEIVSLISQVREKANKLIVDELKKRGVEGLAPSHGSILFQLYKHKSLCMKDIADLINKDKSTITALVNKLERLGYVKKRKDAQDNRITYLELTDLGEEIKESFKAVSKILQEKIYQGFEDDEKQQAVDLLMRLKSNL